MAVVQTRGKGTLPNFTLSAQAVFRHLAETGAATRPQMGEVLQLSRPTMSAAIGELAKFEYVEGIGAVQGTTGRKAAMYRLGQGAGHVIGVDAGSSHISLRAGTLDGRILFETAHTLRSTQRHLSSEISRAVAAAIEEARDNTRDQWGPLRALGIALPARVGENWGPSLVPARQNNIFKHFEPPADVPILLENNVNCAAIAEHNYGAAIDHPDFAYIQVGLKIGMGIILRGELFRGHNGAAGELSRLPFPWGPDLDPHLEELENFLGSESLMQRLRHKWPRDDNSPVPDDSESLFALASQGHPIARNHIEVHAKHIAQMISACVAVVDPGLVVLGGGVGQNALMTPFVQSALDRISYPTQLATTQLGSDATILGIARIAAEHAQKLVIGSHTPT